MARFKPIEKGQGLFISLILEEQFDEYSPERVVGKFVDDSLKLDELHEQYRNDEAGQKAYHPKSLFKVILFAFARGEKTTRQIEYLLTHNISYMYLSDNQKIDHTTISRFIIRNTEIIHALFTRLLLIMDDLELIDWDIIETDGTIASANASKRLTGDHLDFTGKYDTFDNFSKKIIDRASYVAKKEADGALTTQEADIEREKIKRQEKVYKNTMDKIKKFDEDVKEGKIDPKMRTNLTDPDSKLFMKKMGNGFEQGYNVITTVSGNDVVLSIEATDLHRESPILKKKIDEIENLKNNLNVSRPSAYLSDKGFFDSALMTGLLKSGINLYIPIPENVNKHELIKKDSQVFLKYNEQLLRGRKRQKDNEYVFRTKINDKIKEFTVSASFIENFDLWAEYRNKMTSQDGVFMYNKRIGKEHNNQDLKSEQKMARIFRRRSKRVNLEVTLHGIGHNLRKLGKYLKDREIRWVMA